ncbi:hypothetical protein LR48_Vigan03g195200 [Vigna angularis]|uniref:Uncharacterized protein n=1 Tax=Phaseolus angularis TaxID=3914 RepID=A0A0L9U703_PHAAN|nr:hypothetical protein LR48_Vigan03g195200 [Vigna angularis]
MPKTGVVAWSHNENSSPFYSLFQLTRNILRLEQRPWPHSGENSDTVEARLERVLAFDGSSRWTSRILRCTGRPSPFPFLFWLAISSVARRVFFFRRLSGRSRGGGIAEAFLLRSKHGLSSDRAYVRTASRWQEKTTTTRHE